uniref:Cytochrome b n=1 Tax=Aleuroglyphus ovatus TaxID=212130 RepID=A0A023HKA8_ALEOV|nr:cytochrome b [Aleuroglyphus ovatus]AGM14596.1 cytochrome b [Aleuroglyphus ovatus]AID52421.1 cytochrome b [Aleuroglyphus ovatus]QWW33394.1 cytochrome b [Aleuroglyphus ovatus]
MKKYNFILKDPIMEMTKNSLMGLPTPYSISFLWNMGFLLGMTLILQIVTGLVLSMNYVASTEMAFDSVIHIMRDIESGWVMRYLHMNGASLFFILMYIHISRGIYFNSPMKLAAVWTSGVVILLATMGAAFMGYVLPWGQMSFWGATVITSMITAIPYIGSDVTQWLWGNFSVSQPTLNRFFSLHFLIPLALAALAMVHLILLHKPGSSNPTGTNPNYDKMKFFPFFMVKDTTPLLTIMVMMSIIISLSPNMLGDVENFNTASMTTTPAHIQPEWYFLFAYAILRAIPSKLGGVVAMVAAILILLVLMLKSNSMNKKFSPTKKLSFWVFISVALLLTWIGANPVEPPFVSVGQVLTVFYFSSVMTI